MTADHTRPTGAHSFGPVTIPTYEDHEVRAAAIGDDGGQSFLHLLDQRFLHENSVEAATLASSRLSLQAARLEQELSSVRKKLDWTPPTIAQAPEGARVSSLNLAHAVLFGGAAILGLAVSVVVLTEYVLQSVSGLFSRNIIGAVLFGALPSLGAVTLEAFAAGMESARSRKVFTSCLTATGFASLGLWLGAAALVLAPNSGNAASALIDGGNDRLPGMILVVTTVICDTTFGAVLLAGATYWLTLSPASEQVPNPVHVEMTRQRLRLEANLAECQREHEDVQNYLKQAEAGRLETRYLADYAVNRAREQYVEGHLAARAFFTALFLK